MAKKIVDKIGINGIIIFFLILLIGAGAVIKSGIYQE